MAVLDTFYWLFKTNADEARRGMQGAEASAGSFERSVNHADEVVHAAGEHIIDVFTNVAIRIASAFAIEQVLEFTTHIIEANGALQDTSERIGVAVEDLNALQNAAKRFGGSADGATASLDFLNRGMADIAVKGTSRLKPFFDELKVNPLDAAKKVKPLLEVYGELADRFAQMSAQERAGYGEKFGIDQGVLLSLASGRRGFEDIIAREKELGVVTAEDAEAADQFSKKMDDLRVVFAHIATVASSALLPALSGMVDGVMSFVGFLQRHGPFVEEFFAGLATVVGVVYYRAIVRATLATLAFFAEWLAIPLIIAAVAAAFAFAVDDISNFLAGNKSVIGELTKKWPAVGEAVRGAVKGAGEAWTWFTNLLRNGAALVGSVANVIGAIWDRVAAKFHTTAKLWADAFPFWAKALRAIGDLMGWLAGMVERLLVGVAKLAGWWIKLQVSAIAALPKAMGKWAEGFNEAAVAIGGPGRAVAGGASNPALAHPLATAAAIQKAHQQIHIATTTPLAAVPSRAIHHDNRSHTRTVKVEVAKVEVHTQATDADGIAGTIGDKLADHIRQAVNLHDNGVEK